MSNLNEIAGKVVVKVDHIDNFDGGIVITFSDGTSLAVTEYAQTGKLDVSYHNEVSTKPTVEEWVIFAERKRAECESMVDQILKVTGINVEGNP